jgi:hypothetical protein
MVSKRIVETLLLPVSSRYTRFSKLHVNGLVLIFSFRDLNASIRRRGDIVPLKGAKE